MNKRVIHIAAILLSVVFFGCQEEEPVQLTFEDIYGRESWEVEDDENSLPVGLFTIDKTNDITVSEEGDPETGLTFQISTTGDDPHFTTQRIIKALPTENKVLSFMYQSSEDVELSISLDIYNSDAFTKMFSLPAAAGWEEYSFDLAMLIAQTGWGDVGADFRIFLGDQAGVDLTLKELQVRPRTPEEEADANALYLTLNPGTQNQLDEVTDITEIITYNAITYKYVAASGSNDPWVWTQPRPRAIADDENSLTFEYKCETGGDMQVFFVVRGGAATPGLPFEASSEWKKVTYDIAAFKATALSNHADAMDEGHPMRLDINGTAGVPFYFRGLKIHK